MLAIFCARNEKKRPFSYILLVHMFMHTSFILDIDVHSEIGYGWFKANLMGLNDLPQNGL